MDYEDRFEKIQALGRSLERHKREIVCRAAKNIRFPIKHSANEVDVTVKHLGMFEQAASFLKDRAPLGGKESRVSLMLSYNGSSWLNTAIASVYSVGNKVNVKFSSKGSDLMRLTEDLYRPIFGDDIVFCRSSGKNFIDDSLRDPRVSAVVVFGFNENMLPYEDAFRKSGKKLVFEGPGQDPFIVFADADLDLALADLLTAKFMYAGQTCTAPKRIFIHRSVYDIFLERFVEKVRRLVVGDAEDEAADVTPVASDLAAQRIRLQVEDALKKGAKILTGGKIQGTLIHPTVVKDAADDMLGMREEVFGPVAFTSAFETEEEVVCRAQAHQYGLRAAVYGGAAAARAAAALKWKDYCHPVDFYSFGRFGTVSLNQTREDSWVGAFVTKAFGGYGYSGWVWETSDGKFGIKQGPKLFSVETSTGPAPLLQNE